MTRCVAASLYELVNYLPRKCFHDVQCVQTRATLLVWLVRLLDKASPCCHEGSAVMQDDAVASYQPCGAPDAASDQLQDIEGEICTYFDLDDSATLPAFARKPTQGSTGAAFNDAAKADARPPNPIADSGAAARYGALSPISSSNASTPGGDAVAGGGPFRSGAQQRNAVGYPLAKLVAQPSWGADVTPHVTSSGAESLTVQECSTAGGTASMLPASCGSAGATDSMMQLRTGLTPIKVPRPPLEPSEMTLGSAKDTPSPAALDDMPHEVSMPTLWRTPASVAPRDSDAPLPTSSSPDVTPSAARHSGVKPGAAAERTPPRMAVRPLRDASSSRSRSVDPFLPQPVAHRDEHNGSAKNVADAACASSNAPLVPKLSPLRRVVSPAVVSARRAARAIRSMRQAEAAVNKSPARLHGQKRRIDARVQAPVLQHDSRVTDVAQESSADKYGGAVDVVRSSDSLGDEWPQHKCSSDGVDLLHGLTEQDTAEDDAEPGPLGASPDRTLLSARARELPVATESPLLTHIVASSPSQAVLPPRSQRAPLPIRAHRGALTSPAVEQLGGNSPALQQAAARLQHAINNGGAINMAGVRGALAQPTLRAAPNTYTQQATPTLQSNAAPAPARKPSTAPRKTSAITTAVAHAKPAFRRRPALTPTPNSATGRQASKRPTAPAPSPAAASARRRTLPAGSVHHPASLAAPPPTHQSLAPEATAKLALHRRQACRSARDAGRAYDAQRKQALLASQTTSHAQQRGATAAQRRQSLPSRGAAAVSGKAPVAKVWQNTTGPRPAVGRRATLAASQGVDALRELLGERSGTSVRTAPGKPAWK